MPRSTVDGYPTHTSIASPYGNLPFSTSRDLPSSRLIPPEVSSRGNMGRRQSSNDIIKFSRGHAGLARCIDMGWYYTLNLFILLYVVIPKQWAHQLMRSCTLNVPFAGSSYIKSQCQRLLI